jgi:hypothetical protein
MGDRSIEGVDPGVYRTRTPTVRWENNRAPETTGQLSSLLRTSTTIHSVKMLGSHPCAKSWQARRLYFFYLSFLNYYLRNEFYEKFFLNLTLLSRVNPYDTTYEESRQSN